MKESIVTKWKSIGNKHLIVHPNKLENLKIDSKTKLFLSNYGMPSEFQELNFDYLEEENILTVNEKFNLEDSIFDKYIAIGFNSSGDPICINLDNQQIVSLNHDDSFKEVFINSTIKKLAETIIKVDDFRESFSKLTPNSFYETEFTDKNIEELRIELKIIDLKIFNIFDCFWITFFDNLNWEREEERKKNSLSKKEMKRIHLFEIEDQSWFPSWIRDYLTNNLNVFHKLLNTKEELAGLLNKVIDKTGKSEIVDLCSGAGGPILGSASILKEKHERKNLKLTLSDLYPNKKIAEELNSDEDESVSYYEDSLNAEHVKGKLEGIRSMVCSLHHMRPETVTNILKDAQDSKEGFCAIELSDNSYPKWIWWLTIPFSFIICLFITPMVKKLTLGQIVFTYLIPIVPLFFAWDGAVSNARTYTMYDIEIILSKIRKPEYTWEPGVLKEGKSKNMYLLGYPTV